MRKIKFQFFTIVALLITANFWLATQLIAADKAKEEFRTKFLSGKMSWSDVQKEAKKEGRVHFYYWGGDELLNFWVESEVKKDMKKLGVEVVPRRLVGTKDAVDLALTESRNGKGLGQGSVDILWVNGDNFLTLVQQDLLFGSFADLLPNSSNMDWDASNPAASLNLRDFGLPTLKREMPWSGEQYLCTVNRDRVKSGEEPSTFEELKIWLEKKPGRFTYVRPPHYLGATFVQQALYALAPGNVGAEPFQKSAQELGVKKLAELMKPGMDYLRELAPLLNGGGDGSPKYPEDAGGMNTLFKNGEVDLVCQFGIYFVPVSVDQGKIPKNSEVVIFPKGNMIKNKSYLAIMGNAPHPAAALVFADYMSSVKAQADRLSIVGYPPGIDPWKLTQKELDTLSAVAPKLRGVTQTELDANIAPDTNSSLVPIIKEVWAEYVERRSVKPFDTIVANSFSANNK